MASENKSEHATPRRRQKAREQGQVARTSELGAAFAMCAATFALSSQFLAGVGVWRTGWHWALANAGRGEVRPVWGFLLCGQVALRWAVPALSACFGMSLLFSVAQGGVLFAPALLQPKLERISPAAKLKQIFSAHSLVALGKSLIPAIGITYLTVSVFVRDWTVISSSNAIYPVSFTSILAGCLLEATWKCGLVLCAWAAVDFLERRRKFESDLKMTQQEIREELKESEGNPQIKARIRKLQRQVRRKRMLEDVARASVVITNPTEYAIALEYNDKLIAPVVLAKGRNLLAQQIKQAALWSEVPTIENVPLAHALYRTAEVGQTIPAKLYAAVAEVLAFVFRAQARARAMRGVR